MLSQECEKVLIVDDEPALRRALKTSLSASGFTVQEARNGEEAISAFGSDGYDLVLLDINMPGMTGIETCRRLRELSAEVGIVMVTVRDSEDDKVKALEYGADDFVTKPYRFRELLARLRAVLRRVKKQHAPEEPVMRVGDLELDIHHGTLRKAGAQIHLAPKEFELIRYFFQHQDEPLPHSRVLRAVWGPEYGGEFEYLRSYVRMLRKKIEDNPAKPEYILTEPWLGYRFRNPAEPADRPQLSGENN
jgi:two-component system, OmpR family, KDP operon response regulator KdpE